MADEHVDAVLPFVTPHVATMIQVQRLTGMRPGDVVKMRPCDIDTAVDVWIFEPPDHKNRWRGRRRLIPIGPKAQKLLQPYLERALLEQYEQVVESFGPPRQKEKLIPEYSRIRKLHHSRRELLEEKVADVNKYIDALESFWNDEWFRPWMEFEDTTLKRRQITFAEISLPRISRITKKLIDSQATICNWLWIPLAIADMTTQDAENDHKKLMRAGIDAEQTLSDLIERRGEFKAITEASKSYAVGVSRVARRPLLPG